MDCICFSIARQINITYTLPSCKPIQSSNGREFDSWSISVSFRLSETCAKDAQGKKEQKKNRALKYIFCISYESVLLCIHLFTGTRPLSLLLHETITMIGPTLLKRWREAIQPVQPHTIKFLSLRT